jgi:hypothetical protein
MPAHKKTGLVLAFAVGLAVSVAGQDQAPPLVPLKAEMTAIFTGGIGNLYLSADPSVVWKPGLAGVGVGFELITGMTDLEIYANPYLRAELGWLHIDFGYVLPLIRPFVGDGLLGATAGIALFPKPFEVGYGELGFELALDINLSVAATAHAAALARADQQPALVAVIVSSRFGFGLTYGFDLN